MYANKSAHMLGSCLKGMGSRKASGMGSCGTSGGEEAADSGDVSVAAPAPAPVSSIAASADAPAETNTFRYILLHLSRFLDHRATEVSKALTSQSLPSWYEWSPVM